MKSSKNKSVDLSTSKKTSYKRVPHFKNRAPYGTWKCTRCNIIFGTKTELCVHCKTMHPSAGIPWNKGLTKETDKRIAKAAEKTSNGYKEGRFHVWCEGQHLPEEQKKRTSESMKKAQAEGRAHNIGESRWNNEPSYPEKWFMEVIANEFEDKNYVREFPFHRFSLDFAWPEKRKCIEIDGKQHFEDPKQMERDLNKNKLLTEENWSYLRIPWKAMFENTIDWISKANQFIGMPII